MTQSEAKDFWPIVKAWGEGGQLQFLSAGAWSNTCASSFNASPSNYRIKPAPKLRPWKSADEVPLGCRVRRKGVGYTHWLVAGAGVIGADIDGTIFNYREVLEQFEHSTDGGKTWKPCGIEE